MVDIVVDKLYSNIVAEKPWTRRYRCQKYNKKQGSLNPMRENSIFTITPPEMQLSDDGPTITVISTNPEFISKIESAHESMFKTVSVTIYHPDGPVTENNIAWVVSVMRFSDNIFIDLDTATDLGIIGAILSNGNVVFINKDRVRNDIAKLINSMQTDYQIFEEIEDYIEVILHRFN